MDKKNKFDEYLNKQFDKLPETFDPADWDVVEAMLDKDKNKKVLWWYFVLPAAIIIAGIGTYIVAQSEEAQPIVVQQEVVKNNSNSTEPKNIVSKNEPQQSQQSIVENNSVQQTEGIKLNKQKSISQSNIYNNNIVSNNKRKNDEDIRPSGSQIVVDQAMPIMLEAPLVVAPEVDRMNAIKHIYTAKYIYSNLAPDNFILGEFVPIRPKPGKPKYVKNEFMIYGEYGIGFFDLYNWWGNGHIDKRTFNTSGFGIDYNKKISKRLFLGIGAGITSFNIKDAFTVIDSQVTSNNHYYEALEMNLSTGKIGVVTKSEQILSTTAKSYHLEANTLVRQQNISLSLGYSIIDRNNFEIGIGLYNRYNYYNTLGFKYDLGGYDSKGGPIYFHYVGYITKYNTLGISLNMKYKLYKGIYILYEPMFLANTSYNMYSLNPRCLFNNRLGLTYKW